MNDAYTKSPYDIVGCPTKVAQPTAFFSEKKVIFVQLLCRLLASQLGHQLIKCRTFNTVTMVISLDMIDSYNIY